MNNTAAVLFIVNNHGYCSSKKRSVFRLQVSNPHLLPFAINFYCCWIIRWYCILLLLLLPISSVTDQFYIYYGYLLLLSLMISQNLSYWVWGKVLNIRYRDRIGWGFFISDIGYRGRYRGYARISGVHIRHYI